MQSSRRYSFIVLSILGFVLFIALQFGPALLHTGPQPQPHQIEREQAENIAERFVRDRYHISSPLNMFTMYNAEREAYGYLDRYELLEQYFSWEDRLPLDYYTVELKEDEGEFRHYVDVNPYTGAVVEWSVNTGGTPVESEDQAVVQALAALEATGFKTGDVMLDYFLPETGEAGFTIGGFKLKEAGAQAIVTVLDNGISSLRLDWSIPYAYTEEVNRQDTYAAWLGGIGFMLSASLQLAALIYAATHFKEIRFRRGIVLSLLFAGLYVFTNINMLPAIKAMVLGVGAADAAWNGTDTWATLAGTIGGLLSANVLILFLAIGLYFSLASGDTLFRRIGTWKPWLDWSDRNYAGHITDAMRKGYGYAFIILGVQAVLFWAAELLFDSWYTVDAATSPYNLMLPMLMPVLAWCAAISEEGVYRLFGIAALKKLFRFTFAAVLITGIIWALGHVQYPIYPFYTRLIEVTVIGILFGYIFLKHGFITAVFAHAIVDSIWFGLAVLAAPASTADWLAAGGYLLLPIAIAYGIAALHRGRVTSSHS